MPLQVGTPSLTGWNPTRGDPALAPGHSVLQEGFLPQPGQQGFLPQPGQEGLFPQLGQEGFLPQPEGLIESSPGMPRHEASLGPPDPRNPPPEGRAERVLVQSALQAEASGGIPTQGSAFPGLDSFSLSGCGVV